jgi:hypothetical protein
VRAILIPSSVTVFVILIAWLAAGSPITLVLDRFYTVPEGPVPVGQYGLRPAEFLIGMRRWFLAKSLTIALDSQNRVTVSMANRSFTLGPATKRYTAAVPEYEFIPDPSDEISFVKSRSWLSWPTPFQFHIMGGPAKSWRRHSYYRLIWRKSSGAILEIVWRDGQSFYSQPGWTDDNLQIAPEVRITTSLFEEAVVR